RRSGSRQRHRRADPPHAGDQQGRPELLASRPGLRRLPVHPRARHPRRKAAPAGRPRQCGAGPAALRHPGGRFAGAPRRFRAARSRSPRNSHPRRYRPLVRRRRALPQCLSHTCPEPEATMTISNDIAITPELVEAHGLKPDEYERILQLIGRTPTFTELGIFSAMWNEHCSYKSSKKWLRTLPTSGPRVIQGPGENAGVVDIGDGQAVVFKMESHNHPSYIEPYQGAATGVGGILRDVFTMGARPIAAMNALRFGAP